MNVVLIWGIFTLMCNAYSGAAPFNSFTLLCAAYLGVVFDQEIQLMNCHDQEITFPYVLKLQLGMLNSALTKFQRTNKGGVLYVHTYAKKLDWQINYFFS